MFDHQQKQHTSYFNDKTMPSKNYTQKVIKVLQFLLNYNNIFVKKIRKK